MEALFFNQGPQEETEDFNRRVNQELQRLGPKVKDVKLAVGLHERTVGERIRIPSLLWAIMILYEDTV